MAFRKVNRENIATYVCSLYHPDMDMEPITVTYYPKTSIDEILDKYEAYIDELEAHFKGDEVAKTIHDKMQDLVNYIKSH